MFPQIGLFPMQQGLSLNFNPISQHEIGERRSPQNPSLERVQSFLKESNLRQTEYCREGTNARQVILKILFEKSDFLETLPMPAFLKAHFKYDTHNFGACLLYLAHLLYDEQKFHFAASALSNFCSFGNAILGEKIRFSKGEKPSQTKIIEFQESIEELRKDELTTFGYELGNISDDNDNSIEKTIAMFNTPHRIVTEDFFDNNLEDIFEAPHYIQLNPSEKETFDSFAQLEPIYSSPEMCLTALDLTLKVLNKTRNSHPNRHKDLRIFSQLFAGGLLQRGMVTTFNKFGEAINFLSKINSPDFLYFLVGIRHFEAAARYAIKLFGLDPDYFDDSVEFDRLFDPIPHLFANANLITPSLFDQFACKFIEFINKMDCGNGVNCWETPLILSRCLVKTGNKFLALKILDRWSNNRDLAALKPHISPIRNEIKKMVIQ